jgi:hypothetical protein
MSRSSWVMPHSTACRTLTLLREGGLDEAVPPQLDRTSGLALALLRMEFPVVQVVDLLGLADGLGLEFVEFGRSQQTNALSPRR